MAGLFHFSQDAASNDVAAPPISWPEGMPARGVNNSAREMMAALANWHADTTGDNLASGAASGALSISTAQGINLTRSFELSWKVDGRNPGPTTLSVDGSIQRPVQRPGNIDLAPGDLVPGVIYKSRWHPGVARHILLSPIPESPGRVSAFATDASIPDGWLICDGRSLSRTTYAALFTAIGTRYGAPDGNTFRVPDLNGRTVFGADNQGTKTANRLTGAGGIDGVLGTSGGSEATTLTADQMPSHTHTGSTGSAGGQAASSTGPAGGQAARSTGSAGAHDHTITVNSGGSHTHSGTATADTGHAHTYTTAASKNGVAGSGNTNGPFWSGETEASTGTTNPSFNLTINAAGSHGHGASSEAVPAHTHTIAAVADHDHDLPAVAAHAHSLSLNSVGGGNAHPNLPPGLVMLWAIKA